MDYIQLVVIIAVAFNVIVTALNWSKLEPLQRILYPLWILGMCLPVFNQISLINMSILNDGTKV